MGMDVMAIISHNLTSKEILEIPERSKKWNSIKSLYSEYRNPSSEEIFQKKPIWYEYQNMPPDTLNEELIRKIWDYTENYTSEGAENNELDLYWGTLELDFYWGKIEFYQKFILVSSPFQMYKYNNLFSPERGTYVLKLFREVANNFGQSKILYFPDSGMPTSLIFDRVFEKNSFEDVENWANKTFGKPPTEINEAIHNYYFIDDLNSELQKIDPEKEVFKRWDYVDGKDIDRLGIWKGY